MRNNLHSWCLALIMALGFSFFASSAQAREVAEQPFITAAHYKKNISLAEFRVNPRSFFRSEAAFDLIVDYVGGEIGQKLTGSQFVALMRSDQVRVRDCAVSEKINTGALAGNQFHWIVRNCRQGEQIVQVLVNGRWIDVISLNCLNAVEDQTPVPPPAATPPPAAYNPPPKKCRLVPVTQPGTQPRLRYFSEGISCCINCPAPRSLLLQQGGSPDITSFITVCE